ncbi:MAG: hypothetical protein ACXQTI_03805 [Candidatus Nezhaarchaeales archaeon]
MAEVLVYEGVCEIPAEVPAHIIDEWETTLKNAQSRIYNNLLQKIPSDTAFKNFLADASSDVYETFVNPNFRRADVIKMKQRVKLARAYSAWNEGIKNAFDGDSPYFADRVTSKKSKYQLARYVLAAVGSKPDMYWGPLPKAILLLTGDLRAPRYIGANESLTGQPVKVVLDAFVNTIRPMIISEGVYGVTMAYFAHEGGLASLRDDIIREVNQNLEKILNSFMDTTNYVEGGLIADGDYKDPASWTGTFVHIYFDATAEKVKVKARAETVA